MHMNAGQQSTTAAVVSSVIVIICIIAIISIILLISVTLYVMCIHKQVRIIKFPKSDQLSLMDVLQVFKVIPHILLYMYRLFTE